VTPVLTIIAGSNGCGKSTLTASSRDKFQNAPVLDPDAFAKSLQDTIASGASNIEAGKVVLQRAEELLMERQSFTVETTLSVVPIFEWLIELRTTDFRLP
jgi:predicted ABC-type ATPase